jgi:CCR4-NOT transcription complex subunit 7/8
MRTGQSHQAGSDSLLTMATFFKMRELYFDDRIDHDEYNGKLYGLGQTFVPTNSMATSGATMAEREDRQTATATPQSQIPLPAPAIGNALPSALPQATPYGPMGANQPFIRTAIGVGGR